MSIPDNPEDPKDFKSLIDNHGEIDIESIKAFEESYVEGKSRSARCGNAIPLLDELYFQRR